MSLVLEATLMFAVRDGCKCGIGSQGAGGGSR